MRILVLEPYFGGSHKAFLEGLVRIRFNGPILGNGPDSLGSVGRIMSPEVRLRKTADDDL